MHHFKDILFPDSDGDNVLKSIGVSDGIHTQLFLKFMTAAKVNDKKSRVVKYVMNKESFSADEMKLIFLLAYDRVSIILQDAGEKVFKKD